MSTRNILVNECDALLGSFEIYVDQIILMIDTMQSKSKENDNVLIEFEVELQGFCKC